MLCEASPDCVLGLRPNEAEELVGFDLLVCCLVLGFFLYFPKFCTQKKGRGTRAVPEAPSSLNLPRTHLANDLPKVRRQHAAKSLVPNRRWVAPRGWRAPGAWLCRKIWVCPGDLGCGTSQLCYRHPRGHRKYFSLIKGPRALGGGGKSSFIRRPRIAAAQCPGVMFTPTQAPAPSLEAPQSLLGLLGSSLDRFAQEPLCTLCFQVEKQFPAPGRAGALEMQSDMQHQP